MPELIDQAVGVGMMRPKPYDREAWKALTGEQDGKYLDMLKLADLPESLSRARPEQLSPSELKGYGASPEGLPGPKK